VLDACSISLLFVGSNGNDSDNNKDNNKYQVSWKEKRSSSTNHKRKKFLGA